MKYLCLLIAMLWAATLTAAGPLGRVSGAGPLTLDGKPAPSTASSLPVVAGDVIATLRSPATIYLSDGSRVGIEPNSSVKLELVNGSTMIHVLAGNANLNRAAGSRCGMIGGKPGNGHDLEPHPPDDCHHHPDHRSPHEPPCHDHD